MSSTMWTTARTTQYRSQFRSSWWRQESGNHQLHHHLHHQLLTSSCTRSTTDLKKKTFFVNSEIFGFSFGKKNMWITTNLKSRQNSVNQIFNPNAFFFFFLTEAIWYDHAIYRVLKYFLSFTGYEDDIFEVISNSYDQEFKFGGYIYKFGGLLFFVFFTPWSLWSLFFPSLIHHQIHSKLHHKLYHQPRHLLHHHLNHQLLTNSYTLSSTKFTTNYTTNLTINPATYSTTA